MSKPTKSKPSAAPSDTELLATKNSVSHRPEGQPDDVAAIRCAIQAFLRKLDAQGRKIGAARCGVYAFYDYDGEPIYIGQTYEGVGARIGRHLTNQRTDAVAMNVLDPFEVAEIRVWLLEPFAWMTKKQIQADVENVKAALNRAEYTLYDKVIKESWFEAVLNEKPPSPTDFIVLPEAHAGRIIPPDIFPQRKHPDVRIARRASTIAALARVISERKVTRWLRTTLLTQAKRLEKLAAQRLDDFPTRGNEDDEDLESQD